MSKIFTMKLSNGYTIPCPGFGTFKTPDGDVCIEAVREAIAAGYTHIDTAAVYGNERSVGEGVRQSGRARGDLFITSKVWNTDRGYDSTLRACEKSLEDLGMDYLDLYLIHWPANEMQFGDKATAINLDTWKAMERLADEGLVRSIGLSNFYVRHMEPILATANIAPAVDQIEYHPGLLQEDTIARCREEGILVEAWSPLGSGAVLSDPTLAAIAEKYNKSVAQLCIRFALQNDVIPMPKSVTPARIRQNTEVFDFEISDEDMSAISALPELGFSTYRPEDAPADALVAGE